MKKRRLIPILLLRNGWLVQSKQFRRWQNLGNPVAAVKRLSEWSSDELIYLDISRDEIYDLRRDDLGSPNRSSLLDIILDVSKNAFMPVTVGGRIRDLTDVEQRLARGADKVAINSQILETPSFIGQVAREFGSQCAVASIDFKIINGQDLVVSDSGRRLWEISTVEWARKVESLGAGEILLNSVERDGMRIGYDLDTIAKVSDAVRIPVIACGGVGSWDHLAEGLQKTGADAVAAANIFQFTDQSVYLAKQHLVSLGLNVRPPTLFSM